MLSPLYNLFCFYEQTLIFILQLCIIHGALCPQYSCYHQFYQYLTWNNYKFGHIYFAISLFKLITCTI